MPNARTIAASLLLSAAVAHGQVGLTLRPADKADPANWPFLPAELTVRNEGPAALAEVRLRLVDGGPTWRVRVAVPPGSETTATVLLPAVSVSQRYRAGYVRTDRAVAPAEAPVEIAWPIEAVAQCRRAFFDPEVCRAAYSLRAGWPDSTRRIAFLAPVVACLALGAVLLARSPRVRAPAAGIVAALAVVLIAGWLARQELVTVRTISRGKGGVATVLSTRRTTVHAMDSAGVYPVWRDGQEMLQDRAEFDPDGEAEVPLSPHGVRVFRPRGNDKLQAPETKFQTNG